MNQFKEQPLEQLLGIDCFTVWMFHGGIILSVPLGEDLLVWGVVMGLGVSLAYLLFCAVYWSREPRVFRRLSRSCLYLLQPPTKISSIYIFFCLYKSAVTIFGHSMMTSSIRNIFLVTVHLCGEFTVRLWIPAQRPVTRSFDVFLDLRLNKRLSKPRWCWRFETPSRPLWRHCNATVTPWDNIKII